MCGAGLQKVGAGWFASGALIAFQRAERFNPLGALHGAVGKNLGRAFVAVQTRGIVAGRAKGLCKRRFSIWQRQFNQTIAASKICGTKFKEKKNK